MISTLQAYWVAVKATLFSWLNSPLHRYQQELDALLLPREEYAQLYLELIKGHSADQMVAAILEKAGDATIPLDQRGKANLVLSILYQEGVENSHLNIKQDTTKSAHYREIAVQDLGVNPTLSPQSSRCIESIKLGGESYYAFKKLQERAINKQDPMAFWPNKILSYVYRHGINRQEFHLSPSIKLADSYQQRAYQGLERFNKKLRLITNTLKNSWSSWFDSSGTYFLIKRIAKTGNQYANFHYSLYLEKKKSTSGKVMTYLQMAADHKEEDSLHFETTGYLPAVSHLASKEKRGDETTRSLIKFITDRQGKLSSSLVTSLLKAAKGGEVSDLLAASLYFIENNDVSKAEKYYSQVLLYPKELSALQQEWFEQVTLKLSDYYKNLFLKNPSSIGFKLDTTARQHLRKVIYYLSKIPPDASRYEIAQYDIAHYQKYFLHNDERANNIFKQLSCNGDVQSASLAVSSEFKQFWNHQKEKMTPYEKETVAQYEKGHEPFIDQIKVATDNKIMSNSALDLVKRTVAELSKHLVSQPQLSKIPTYIEELNRLIQEHEKVSVQSIGLEDRVADMRDFLAKNNPALKERFEHLWRRPHSQTVKPTFFAKPVALSKSTTLLQTCISLLLRIQEEKNKDPAYFEILENSYLDYLAIVCKQIFNSEVAKENPEEINNINKDEGVTSYVR